MKTIIMTVVRFRDNVHSIRYRNKNFRYCNKNFGTNGDNMVKDIYLRKDGLGNPPPEKLKITIVETK